MLILVAVTGMLQNSVALSEWVNECGSSFKGTSAVVRGGGRAGVWAQEEKGHV